MVTDAIPGLGDCWFPTLSPNAFATLRAYGRSVLIPKGTMIFSAGTHVDEAILIHEGAVKVWCATPDGPLTLRIATRSDIVGFAAVFHEQEQCASAEALSDLVGTALTLADIRRVFVDRPDLRLPLLAVLTEESDVRPEVLTCAWNSKPLGKCPVRKSC
jgi:CRP/FNR family cyclic AMP-dependent transcriptional regulator